MMMLYLEGARGSDWTDLPFLVLGLIAVALGEVLLYLLAGLAILAAVGWWLWKG